MTEKLAGVPNFVLPQSHSSYTITAPPPAGSLSDLKSRWVLLKQKVIVHKSHDGWRIGQVWKKGVGKKYGDMIWVTYGGSTIRGGHDFDPKDYGEDKMWVVLCSHQVVIDQVKWCCMCVVLCRVTHSPWSPDQDTSFFIQ